MSGEIVMVLKNGKIYAGDTYRYNHYTRQFELLNYVVPVAIRPDEIQEIRAGKISENSADDRGLKRGQVMMDKTCRNCGKTFTDYREFKEHIKECNKRITIGDIMKGKVV